MVWLSFATRLERAEPLKTTNLHVGASVLYSTEGSSPKNSAATKGQHFKTEIPRRLFFELPSSRSGTMS